MAPMERVEREDELLNCATYLEHSHLSLYAQHTDTCTIDVRRVTCIPSKAIYFLMESETGYSLWIICSNIIVGFTSQAHV